MKTCCVGNRKRTALFVKRKSDCALLASVRQGRASCYAVSCSRAKIVIPRQKHSSKRRGGLYVNIVGIHIHRLARVCEAGLLRHLKLDGAKSYYDTDVSHHQHFYVEDDCQLIDMPAKVRIRRSPAPPSGYSIERIDLIIRLRRRQGTPARVVPRKYPAGPFCPEQ
jgi:Fur family transcriptional regulator, iron response regulator